LWTEIVLSRSVARRKEKNEDLKKDKPVVLVCPPAHPVGAGDVMMGKRVLKRSRQHLSGGIACVARDSAFPGRRHREGPHALRAQPKPGHCTSADASTRLFSAPNARRQGGIGSAD